ncbi:hypothetical protein AaE_015432 [Aphanomyces astaci]|uniref:Uncharacterized protein n=1 Tax=Aphanomyces astaci TaxID=112090 RepID=A0A6A4YXB6_APHAT|nr:hypothetical protein AaE_015432 [Aphanomyces astaci]
MKSQTWDFQRSNPYYDLLKEFEDVFPDEVPCLLPVDKGVQHEIDLVPGDTYCVTRQCPLPREQPGGKWRIIHAFKKLIAATIPAQTPIPHKDIIIDGMGRSTIFSTIDLRAGFYQILMRLCNVPKTAVSTPSDMLWEWFVMSQGLSNAPAMFNRMAKFRAIGDFAPSYFDDIYVHSCASAAQSDCYPGLATYLHKYSYNFAAIAQPLFRLFLKDAPWVWDSACQSAFEGLKLNLVVILALLDFAKPFSVVCDTSQYAIGCCLIQLDATGLPCPVSYKSRQLHPAERGARFTIWSFSP